MRWRPRARRLRLLWTMLDVHAYHVRVYTQMAFCGAVGGAAFALADRWMS